MLRRFGNDERGAISIIMAVLMVPLIGAIGLGCEVSYWALTARHLQNAADSSAISAALNGGSSYDLEARAVATLNGIKEDDGFTASNTAACPDGSGPLCFSVTISRSVPLLFAQVIGFRGDGHGQMGFAATAVASPSAAVLCVVALGSIVGFAGDLNGCNSMADTGAQCDGSLGLGTSFSHGANSGCGVRRVSQPILLDPYPTLASNIPAHACAGGTSPPLSGTLTLNSGDNFLCGDQRLSANVTLSAPIGQGATLFIVDGHLDLNGHTLTTGFGSAVTLVFSGTASGVTHAPVGVGGLDITPPTTGPWKGVAMAQDPTAAAGTFTIGDNWRITGLIYAPRATINWTGMLAPSTNGRHCSVVVADTLAINGGGIAKANLGQCAQAGLSEPRVPGAGARLVQ